MGDQNRRTFKYRIRQSGQNQSDPRAIRRLKDLEPQRSGSAVGRVDDSLRASAEDIAAYRQSKNRQRQ
ncbi:MAG: hypothetical protein A3J46_03925 [Candidatus Yanofskybacteria bacterium RIFCSPHIGHO2_02_FULL_41_11]|uniref:Uncharacterized protein n=1 Tax=Candidatus Yanofskybacteria bacterium RIFCSPHIGHO2_02_FULL_41_11 TaxID=1802675 RepID=A0A1F8F9S4_9BACT|nr:MAG: hypothetical protein A3J46_03925 [Candidatus Yanofskybacteria bacterium RIFCSPHIGHO2_02_FULL_41_11]